MIVMKKIVPPLLLVNLLFLLSFCANGQQTDRISQLEQRLRNLIQNVPGLNENVETSISNGSLQEFLRGLATTHNLNLNIDPAINQKITSYFSNEKVITVLLYVAREYNLDFNFTGSIISIFPYRDPLANLPPKPKDIQVEFDSASQALSLDLEDDSLLLVAKKITRLSGKNVVVVPELYGKKVTGYILKLKIQNALEKLAITNSFKFDKTNDEVFVLEALRQDEQIIPRQNPAANNDFTVKRVFQINNNTLGNSSVNVSSGNNGEKLVTLNITSAPLKDVLKNIFEQGGINYFVYSDIVGAATANVQNMEIEKVLGFIFQGTKYTFNVHNGVYMIGDRQDEGLRAQQLIQLKNRSVDSLLAVIPQELREGVEIREFKELNSFLLSGSGPKIKEIETFVRQLDKTVPMVLIEVILMDVTKSRTISTGINMGISDSVKTGGRLIGGGIDFTFGAKDVNRFIDQIGLNNVFNIGRVSPNFYVSLQAMENKNNIDLRQTPKLSTLNGHSATLSIGNTRYYQVSTQNVLGSLNPQTVVTQQFFPIEANLSIAIKPFVSGNEQITLNIDVSISDFTANTTINVPPPTATSKFQSIIRVKNEEMVVLGGIERAEKSSSSSGVPLLSRIPIIKWLFSSRDKTDSKTISVVFIKPTIIY